MLRKKYVKKKNYIFKIEYLHLPLKKKKNDACKKLDFKTSDTDKYSPTSQSSFIPKELQISTHAWLQINRVRLRLETSYRDLYKLP